MNEIRTSKEWLDWVHPEAKVIDPDGWDRKNFDYSFNREPITADEFERRFYSSRAQIPKGGIWA